MNKTELVSHVVENVDGLSKVLATKVVNAVFDAIKHGLKHDGDVAIVGHGSYVVAERAARDGRHPKTGAVMRIPSTKVVRFKVGKDLKDEVNK
ncbi:MAG: HU family DNA-binding protein [Gammaproteobacteria bacterium]|nr:HU family DNA-binding protein [Gammaproteobacteria bacterium]